MDTGRRETAEALAAAFSERYGVLYPKAVASFDQCDRVSQPPTRRVLKTRGALPSDESVMKLLYLALQRASQKGTRSIQNWPGALNRFAIEFEGRVPLP